MKTKSVKAGDIKKKWLVMDVQGMSVGRAASQIAYVLRGKHKPDFVPHLDCGDNVIVLNADKVKLTGQKATQKFYYRYTNYIGGLKSKRADDMLASNPSHVIEAAVKGMLPRGKLGRKVIKNLKVYAGSEHSHEAQKPEPMPERLCQKGN